MKYRIITHVHTKYSHDSLLPFFLLYNKCIKKSVDYIAITEHNNIKGAVAFRNYCANKGNKIKVIIGEEIMTSEGEIIGLFLNQEIKPFQSPEKTVDEI
ncbi:PHP domain-containing protein, partial [Dialister succinatiphilus]